MKTVVDLATEQRNEGQMRTSKNGLFLCRKGASKHTGSAGSRARVFELPAPKRPPLSMSAKVFMAILYLLMALYVWTGIKDLRDGREPILLDGGGAPRPCAPPSQGVWPDCHESGRK